MPLCGVMVDGDGGVFKSFGRYKNARWQGNPQVSYSYSTKRYTVRHSIPDDKYIPTVQITGNDGNNNDRWSLAARVFNVQAYSFEVAIITNNDNLTPNGFSYVCFKAE